ncbi:telomeric repeat-binding factor 2-interacting protein 1 [Callorhinchus milii]|uniref:telomeric repeat-binding factor 2-interacting protein 1 n=1 Tax=Callorhinchus milii TaxID=7868 RepID=UPI001C3FF56E|nr:telomeric repeat-binding factor 2-interacting protein 1 [Callorhinchus milii]
MAATAGPTSSSAATTTTFTHSRTLFLDDSGAPLRFYMRPSSTKAVLLPLVTHGGGVMCGLQAPGALLLAELGPGPPLKGHVAARYVLDCVERNERLDVEDYRERPAGPRPPAASRDRDPAPRGERPRDQPPAAAAAGAGSRDPDPATRVGGGRSAYTRAEDVTLLMYVRDHGGRAARGRGSLLGNAFWRHLERLALTGHTWQSMRDRYLRHLRGRERDYQLDSRTVIPAPVRLLPPPPPPDRADPASPNGGPGPPAAQPGKMSAVPARHKDGKGERGGAGHSAQPRAQPPAQAQAQPRAQPQPQAQAQAQAQAGPEDECFNIFPIAIREFEDEESPELQITEVDQQQIETETLPQQQRANNLPKKTGTLAEFIINNAQSESESQTQVDANSFSPTPSQNEVDSAVKAIETLRQEYHLDLCGATQVLLKNNGDLVATMHFMATGHRPDGHPIWTHQDDLDLESEEQNVKERLVKMFGADHLAKRRAFKNS